MNKRANILIVDDEQVVRLSHLRSLATADFEATAVGSGSEALSLMECHPYDVIFLDLRMPGLDGIAVLKAIKQRWPECEVVIITGYPTLDTAKEAVQRGAYHYLVKPVSPNDVIEAASQALLHKQWALRTVRPGRDDSQSEERGDWSNGLPPQYA